MSYPVITIWCQLPAGHTVVKPTGEGSVADRILLRSTLQTAATIPVPGSVRCSQTTLCVAQDGVGCEAQ